jgi:hypothetical protein
MAPRTAVVGRDDTADGGEVRLGRVERQPLPSAPQHVVDCVERGARRRRGHEVAGDMVDRRIQAEGRQHHVCVRGGSAPGLFGAGAANRHGQLPAIRPFQFSGDACGIGRLDQRQRH